MVLNNTMIFGDKLSENKIPTMPYGAIVKFKSVTGLEFGLTKDHLTSHLLNIGATGTGKTNAILHLIKQIKSAMNKDDVMIVFDSKLDFTAFHTEKDLVISNRKKQATAKWNIFMDIVADGWDEENVKINCDEIADVIFSDAISKSNNPFFPQAARDIFSIILQGMIRLGENDMSYRIKYLNNAALRKYLDLLDANRLREFLSKLPSLSGVLKYVGDGRSEQALGVFAELQAVTGKIFTGCFGKTEGRFSVRKMEKQRNGATLFVEYDPSKGMALQPIYKIIVDLFIKEALSSECPKGNVYVICDELKMLPHLNHFEVVLWEFLLLPVSRVWNNCMKYMEKLQGETLLLAFKTPFVSEQIMRHQENISKIYTEKITYLYSS